MPSKYVNSLENYMKNAPAGVNFCDCQGADDNPDKGSMSICMTYANEDPLGEYSIFFHMGTFVTVQ